jgi:hypothetical protein
MELVAMDFADSAGGKLSVLRVTLFETAPMQLCSNMLGYTLLRPCEDNYYLGRVI